MLLELQAVITSCSVSCRDRTVLPPQLQQSQIMELFYIWQKQAPLVLMLLLQVAQAIPSQMCHM